VRRSQPSRNGERAGIEARGALGLGETQPLDDILRSLERTTELQIFVRPLGEDGVAGAYWVSQDVPFILVNGDQPVQRQRFTLAHEFGHYRLGHGNQIDERVGWSEGSPIEVEANAFAAAFLMPPAAVTKALESLGRPQMTFDVLITLAALFGISAKAMRIRLETLDMLKPQQITEFDGLINTKQHHGRAAQLGIPPVIDSLEVAKREGGHLPPLMERKVILALDHDLLPEEIATKILRTDRPGLEAIRERFAVASE
jgi:Zn-dependent peptidase ImmA (M78 family)